MLLCLAAVFPSCEQDANIDVDIPDMPPKLVINSFITPQDTFIRVRVTKSNPIFGSQDIDPAAPVENATVKIFGNNTSVVLTYDAVQELYFIATTVFSVNPGNEYRLEVSAPGMSDVSSITVVPPAPPADFSASFVSGIDSSQVYWWQYNIESVFSFTDVPLAPDYYRIEERLLSYDPFTSDSLQRDYWQSLLIEENEDGGAVEKSSYTYYTLNHDVNYYEEPVAMIYYFFRCSESYYKYHVGLYNFSGGGGGDPFTEPSFMYSNISGGYGIFAAANYAVKRVNF